MRSRWPGPSERIGTTTDGAGLKEGVSDMASI
jgi:hypothetical protein